MLWIRLIIGTGVFIGIMTIGFISQILTVIKRNKDIDFLNEYFNNFIEYSKGKRENYAYLLEKFNQAQDLLGINGILEKIKFPYENVYHLNVPVLALINHLNEAFVHNNMSIDENTFKMIDFIQTAFLRTLGDYERYIDKIRKNIINPFINFHKGFYFLVTSPFVALSYMFTGKNIFIKERNRILYVIFKIATFLIQVIGLISAIMSIILGWDEFISLLK